MHHPSALTLIAIRPHRLHQPDPGPGPDPIELVESVRHHVLRAVTAVVCQAKRPDPTAAEHPVTSWTDVENLTGSLGEDLLDLLSRPICRHAPIAAAVVAAWRALAHAAIDHRDGLASWQQVTDRAEHATRSARWIYSGGYAHATGAS